MQNLFTSLAQAVDISPGDIDVPKPAGGLNSNTVEQGLNIFFGIAAAVAVLIIAISAFRIIISRGNSQDVQKARDAIIYASIGLVITMTAFAIVTFVIGRV